MKVKIWSDVRCPFCYIGKHKFEAALERFSHKAEIEVEWKSFELDPSLRTQTQINALDHLAKTKGISRPEVEQMTQYAAQAGMEVGLELNFDQSVVANSFQAHRLVQLAKSRGLGNEIEEELFKAHFTNGLNIDDTEVLVQLGVAAGIKEDEVLEVLSSDAFADAVRRDQAEAQSLGVRGVPFFVFNDKYGVSGAQPVETFLGALNQSWDEYAKSTQPIMFEDGPSCSADGDCL